MYKLYYAPGACSLAIHALLIESGQPFEAISKSDVADFAALTPLGAVPLLEVNGEIIREGAAQALYLIEEHDIDLLPKAGEAGRAKALEWLLFANATMHPAYSKMFFAMRAIEDEAAKAKALEAGAGAIAKLWSLVDKQLATTPYVTGDKLSIADIMLTVYANWGGYFSVEIPLGANVKRLLKEVSAHPSFARALAAEGVDYKAAA